MERFIYFAVIALTFLPASNGHAQSAKLLGVAKIWDEAPHSAFTDLTVWNSQFVCAFREGRAHVSADGKIRVLTSPDGESWKSSAVVSLEGFDLRDAGLSITPAGRLMLIGGASPRKNDGDGAPTGSFVSFSDDAVTWTKPEIVSEPGRWLWRVTWHDGKAYGIDYSAGSKDRAASLLVSADGTHYRALAPRFLDQGWPTESVVRFDDDGTMYCLARRDGEAPADTAMFASSKPPYTEWKWHDLGKYFGGPNFMQLPDGSWIAAGRIFTKEGPKTHVARLDVSAPALDTVLELPSGGDNSYPGLVYRDGILWVSYYSSHEGKGKIYLAKVELDGQNPAKSTGEAAAATKINSDSTAIAQLRDKPLYEFTEDEIGQYLKFLNASEPDLRKRIAHLARKNIGQPYELYLLGEAPYETHDPQPIYCLGKSDCVVFSEHTYAMALSHDWPSFMKMLQRIRYRDGQIGVTTRNHYTEADWNKSNNWLVEDITAELAGEKAVKFHQAIDRANFFKKRYKMDVDVPVQNFEDVFINYLDLNRVRGKLQTGDFVNIIRGTVGKDAPSSDLSDTFGGNAWAGHVGMIVLDDEGRVNLIHSTQPSVREEPLGVYVARAHKDVAKNDAEGKPRLLGFKFLRLRENPMKNLREIDGDDAPKVTLPDGSEAKF